jgi:DNA polymerase III epsilon subunit-like protein
MVRHPARPEAAASSRDVSGQVEHGRLGRGTRALAGLSGAAPTCAAPPVHAPLGQETRVGILLDTETTGLDHAKDEIIGLGMVKFDYSADGRLVGVRDTFSAFNEPSAPIPAEVML